MNLYGKVRTVKKVASANSKPVSRRSLPAMTLEARENQLISYAVDLAEKQLLEGTASSQVITHYLKLGTTRERLEKEKLQEENRLLRAKAKAIDNAEEVKKLYENAISAFNMYRGHTFDTEEYEDDPDIY